MFARNVSLRLKPDCLKKFVAAFENEVLPVLRQQAGFREGIMLGSEDTSHVNAISLWDTNEQADAYAIAIFPGILQDLDRFFDGPPKVRITSVISSTLSAVATAS